MNEKIEELYAEAKQATKIGRMNAPMGVVAEKFAELIVREMCNVLEKGQDDADMNTASETNWAYINVLEDWITRLKEHFGVKE